MNYYYHNSGIIIICEWKWFIYFDKCVYLCKTNEISTEKKTFNATNYVIVVRFFRLVVSFRFIFLLFSVYWFKHLKALFCTLYATKNKKTKLTQISENFQHWPQRIQRTLKEILKPKRHKNSMNFLSGRKSNRFYVLKSFIIYSWS